MCHLIVTLMLAQEYSFILKLFRLTRIFFIILFPSNRFVSQLQPQMYDASLTVVCSRHILCCVRHENDTNAFVLRRCGATSCDAFGCWGLCQVKNAMWRIKCIMWDNINDLFELNQFHKPSSEGARERDRREAREKLYFISHHPSNWFLDEWKIK